MRHSAPHPISHLWMVWGMGFQASPLGAPTALLAALRQPPRPLQGNLRQGGPPSSPGPCNKRDTKDGPLRFGSAQQSFLYGQEGLHWRDRSEAELTNRCLSWPRGVAQIEQD